MKMRSLLLSLLLCAGLSPAFAASVDDHDRTHVGQSINVAPGEQTGDATCFGCSIRVRGKVNGDVTVFGGQVEIEDQGQVSGDVTVFGGGVRLDPEVKIAGDVAVFGGRFHRDPHATVGGDMTTVGGPGWIVPIVLAPFLFLGLIVWAIVWIVRRLLRWGSGPVTAQAS